jgi:hypothetical protein
MVRTAALIALLLAGPAEALPPCADKVEAGAVVSCPDSWLGIPRWVSYRASKGSIPGVYAAAGTALGRAVSGWVAARGAIQVYEGPAFPRSGGETRIRWKNGTADAETVWAFAVAVSSGGGLDSIAVIAPAAAPMIASPHIVSIDRIEALTGLDFLGELPDRREGPLEAARAKSFWGAPVAPPKPKPKPAPAPPPKPKPAPPKAVVEPKLPTQKPSDMSDTEWEAHRFWVEGSRLMDRGDLTGARESFTRCVEMDDKRSDCSSAIMRTFGVK